MTDSITTTSTTTRTEDSNASALFVAALVANLVFLGLALLDWYVWDREYIWAVFIPWAAVILLTILVALMSASSRVHILRDASATPALARAVATLAARPTPSPAPVAVPSLDFQEDAFPFTYNGFTLYSRKVDLKNGGARTIWFFSKRIPASGEKSRKPSGFHVGVNERTGLPFLKKGGGKDGEDLTPHLEHALRPQCSALTEDGKQCRNSARADSKYCASHFGYQPPQIAKAEAARKDTLARVKGARDTVPSVRKKSSS
ncbi:MAG: hypothetical protein QOJ26_1138 [Thermoplasmata archaeon]|jgi:hypothetical protein|nr:hypothetical protein [Thermoplasmata archaeon]